MNSTKPEPLLGEEEKTKARTGSQKEQILREKEREVKEKMLTEYAISLKNENTVQKVLIIHGGY